jgi:hypothetical protein
VVQLAVAKTASLRIRSWDDQLQEYSAPDFLVWVDRELAMTEEEAQGVKELIQVSLTYRISCRRLMEVEISERAKPPAQLRLGRIRDAARDWQGLETSRRRSSSNRLWVTGTDSRHAQGLRWGQDVAGGPRPRSQSGASRFGDCERRHGSVSGTGSHGCAGRQRVCSGDNLWKPPPPLYTLLFGKLIRWPAAYLFPTLDALRWPV